MAKQNDTLGDWAKQGFVLVGDKLVKSNTLVADKVEKISPSLNDKNSYYLKKMDDDKQTMAEEGGEPFARALMFGEKQLPGGANKKIMNATKSVNDEGVKFDSNLERYMYGLLKGAEIDFDFQVEYLLQERFRYNDEAVRAITLTVDFLLPTRNVIIDTKGYANDRAPMKYKMLKKWLIDNWRTFDHTRMLPTIHQPSNKKECDLLLNKLLYEHSN